MSEEKLYAVKDDEGEYWDFGGKANRFWSLLSVEVPVTDNKEIASTVAKATAGHVVAFVEEPKKVALNKEQAEIVDDAHGNNIPASFMASKSDDEELMMNAYVNGYTVAKEKKYLVYKELGGKQKNKLFAQAYRSSIFPGTISWILTNEVKSGSWAQFTKSEIEHYGLQDCEKEEVTDDGND